MGEGLNSLLPFVLMFVVVYFFMIAPQMKRTKREKKFISDLKRGDRVVTKSGLHAKVIEINDNTCVIESMAGKMKYNRSAISMEMSDEVNKKTTPKA